MSDELFFVKALGVAALWYVHDVKLDVGQGDSVKIKNRA